jgi:hypothetical protein
MSSQLRPHFERDIEDCLLITKEALIVLWRFNPAGIGAHLCQQLFENINDSTPPDEKAVMVAQTLESIEIVPVETYEADFSNGVAEFCKGISGEIIKGAIKVYPQIEEFLKSAAGDEDTAITQSFTRMTLSAVGKQRGHYEQLEKHFKQLQEFLPRYTSVMSRTGFLDGILGFAAGFFGGYLGAVGAQAWDNWRGSNDQEFCQKFGSAFEQFAKACYDYTVNGEESLSLVFDRLTDETRRLHHKIFDAYEELESSGWDIEPLYRQYRTIDEPLGDDAKQFLEIAISNLEENRSIHYRSIENIRQLLGLSTALAGASSNPPPPPVPREATRVPPPLPPR